MSGNQIPRVSSVPLASRSLGAEAVELAAMAGLSLDEWQRTVLEGALGEREDGKWSAFEVGLVVARQNGKNAILEARELAGLFLLGEKLIIHSAHEAATAAEAFRRLLDRIESSPVFSSRVARVQRGKGVETIELKTGERIWFRTRTKGGGRGFTADCVIFDEAMILPESVIGALVPTMSARSSATRTGPQIWYTGSAVDEDKHEHGVVLTRVRNRGLEGARDLAFFEWSAPDDSRPDDVLAWAAANPALGIRISHDHVARELASMPEGEFRVERLGIGNWPDLSENAGRVISAEAWMAVADPESRVHDGRCFAIDIAPGQAWASVAAAGRRADGLWHVGVVRHERDMAWVTGEVLSLAERYPGARVVVDPRADLADLISELYARGVAVVKMSAQDVKEASGGFFRAVVERQVRFRAGAHPELDAAVAGAKTRPLLDAWKWDRSSPCVITPLIAATLALWGARTQGSPEVHSVREVLERLKREQAPDNASVIREAPLEGGQRFVPLDQAPVQRGVFRPFSA